jgi:hypothetical protein
MLSRRIAANRRQVTTAGLVTAASLVIAASLGMAGPLSAAQTASGARFGSVRVDASGFAAKGMRNFANRIEQTLAPQLRRVFADRMGGGATLSVAINSVEMANYAGYEFPPDNFDWMGGVGRVIAGGKVVAEYPLTVNISAGASGPYNLPNIDSLRVNALCNQFAIMLRQQMGL